MDNLRWALLVVAVVVVAGLYLWESRRRARRRDEEGLLDESERQILENIAAERGPDDPFADLADLRGERVDLDFDLSDMALIGGASRDEVPPVPDVEPAPRPAPAARARQPAAEPARARGGEELIVVLNLAAPEGSPFRGPALRDALESVEMRFGDMDIFHHHGVGDMRTDEPVFSAASMVKPGTLRLDALEDLSTPGLTLFMRLPGPLDPKVAFELMLNTGHRLAQALGGELWDETRSVLSAQTIAHIRERIAEFNRRRLLLAS